MYLRANPRDGMEFSGLTSGAFYRQSPFLRLFGYVIAVWPPTINRLNARRVRPSPSRLLSISPPLRFSYLREPRRRGVHLFFRPVKHRASSPSGRDIVLNARGRSSPAVANSTYTILRIPPLPSPPQLTPLHPHSTPNLFRLINDYDDSTGNMSNETWRNVKWFSSRNKPTKRTKRNYYYYHFGSPAAIPTLYLFFRIRFTVCCISCT